MGPIRNFVGMGDLDASRTQQEAKGARLNKLNAIENDHHHRQRSANYLLPSSASHHLSLHAEDTL